MRIGIGVAGIGVELLCVAGVALDAPAVVWVLALLIGALLIVFAFAFGESAEEPSVSPIESAAGGDGDGHVRGNVFGDNASITISERDEPPPATRKTRVRLSLAELTQIHQDHTTIQAKKLAQPYIGGWLEVAGPVNNVTEDGFGDGYRVSLNIDQAFVFVTFVDEVQEQIPQLRRGEFVTILGRIAEIDGFTLTLEEAEFLEPNREQRP
jgi:hypothetical protein